MDISMIIAILLIISQVLFCSKKKKGDTKSAKNTGKSAKNTKPPPPPPPPATKSQSPAVGEKSEKKVEEKSKKEEEKKEDEKKEDEKKEEEKKEDEKSKKEEEKKEEEKKEDEKKEDEKKDEKKEDEKKKDEKKSHILVQQGDELEFKAKGAEQKKAVLKNVHDKKIMFKIKSSNNNDYVINPVFGTLEPNGTVDIKISHKSSAPKTDKLVIMNSVFSGNENDLEKTFKISKMTGSAANIKLVSK